jgi:hypothetical protein
VFTAEALAEWRGRLARLGRVPPGVDDHGSVGKATGYGLVRRVGAAAPAGWTLTNLAPTPDAVLGLAVEGAAGLDPVATWGPASGVTLGGAW